MNENIIADSCCDVTTLMKDELNITLVPLTMMLGKHEYVDDDNLNLQQFLQDMKECKEKVGSAAPSPYLYQKAIQKTKSDFIITLSSCLSSSYSHAVLGSKHEEKESGHVTHVFDSKSASAGETLVAIKLHELLRANLSKERIIKEVTSFINTMKTYFVLENYDNLQKNGRLGKVAGSLIRVLNIKLIMGDDGNGDITLHGRVRGENRMIDYLLGLIEKSGKKTENENLVLAHCNNLKLAEQISSKILERFRFKKIYIVPTGGISSLYADDKGVIMAF